METGQNSQEREEGSGGERAVGDDHKMNLNCQDDDDLARKPSAKARLYDTCAGYKWKQPVFECCKEEGVSHSKLFTFKVVVETVDVLGTAVVLECFGAPRPKKKAAANDAAEGVLWYLKQHGMNSPKTKRTHRIESEDGVKGKKPKNKAEFTTDLHSDSSQTATAY